MPPPMALALNRIGTSALRGSFRIRPRRTIVPIRSARRSFHPSPLHREDENSKPPTSTPAAAQNKIPTSDPVAEPGSGAPALEAAAETTATNLPANASDKQKAPLATSTPSTPADEPFQPASIYASPEEEARFEALLNDPPPEHAAAVERFQAEMESLERKYAAAIERDRPPEIKDPALGRFKGGFMSMGEDDEEEEGEDEPFEGDDVTSIAHGEIEQHRELREYARIAAWEMPLLSKFAKTFEPPTDTPLRFRYTSYMGESHPAENKVVLEFCIGDLPLTHAQRLKLVKLAGVRYDPQSDIVKMSCEMFDTIAQNKRYLGDLVDTLMATAKGEGDAEGAKDTFEDVPVDFRHVKWKKVPEFPEEWKLTDKRMAEIEQKRIERAEKEQQRLEEGQLVDGSHIIERAARMPVMAPAGAAKLGGGRGSQRVSSVR